MSHNNFPDSFDTQWECYPRCVRGNLGEDNTIDRELSVNTVATYAVGGMDFSAGVTLVSTIFSFDRTYVDHYLHRRRMQRPMILDLDSATTGYGLADVEDTLEEWSGTVSENFTETAGKTLLFADLRHKHFEHGGQEVTTTVTFSGSNDQPIGTSLLWIGTGFMGNIFVRDVIAFAMTANKSVATTERNESGEWTTATVNTTPEQLAYTTGNEGCGPTNDYYWGQYLVVNDTTPEPFNIKYERNDNWLEYPMVFAPFWIYTGFPLIPDYAALYASYYVQSGTWQVNAGIIVDKRGLFYGSWAIDRDDNEFISWLIDGFVKNSLTNGNLAELFPVEGTGLKFYPIAPL